MAQRAASSRNNGQTEIPVEFIAFRCPSPIKERLRILAARRRRRFGPLLVDLLEQIVFSDEITDEIMGAISIHEVRRENTFIEPLA